MKKRTSDTLTEGADLTIEDTPRTENDQDLASSEDDDKEEGTNSDPSFLG